MSLTFTQNIRIAIADDHQLFRDGLITLLNKRKNIEIVGVACNGHELLELVEKVLPDVVLVDIQMPVMDGIRVTQSISAEFPSVKVIALSMYDQDHFVVKMLNAGARGYLLKNASKEEVFEAINAVYNDNMFFSSMFSYNILRLLRDNTGNTMHKPREAELTKREVQVIQFVCKQHSNKEIADMLNISIRSVESCREKIQKKIGAKNVAGMVVYAIRKGFYSVE